MTLQVDDEEVREQQLHVSDPYSFTAPGLIAPESPELWAQIVDVLLAAALSTIPAAWHVNQDSRQYPTCQSRMNKEPIVSRYYTSIYSEIVWQRRPKHHKAHRCYEAKVGCKRRHEAAVEEIPDLMCCESRRQRCHLPKLGYFRLNEHEPPAIGMASME